MTIQEMGSIGEFVGGLVVLITLAYLVVQTKQNSKMLQVSTFSQTIEQSWVATLEVARDGELADIVERGWSDPDALSQTEARRFGAYTACVTWGLLYTHYFHEQRAIPDEIWENMLDDSASAGFYATPGFRNAIARRPGSIAESFRTTLTERYGIEFGHNKVSD